MITVLAGTDRPLSRSRTIANLYLDVYQSIGEDCQLMCLTEVNLTDLGPSHYAEAKPPKIKAAVETLLASDGIHFIVPEYNGSMPGALKLFIDQWQFPESFEHRPFAFTGLGGRFGGLRPVEHLQQVVGYRNGFIYPDRVFLQQVWNLLKDGKIQDETINDFIFKQAQGFSRFIRALRSENLHGKDYKSKL